MTNTTISEANNFDFNGCTDHRFYGDTVAFPGN